MALNTSHSLYANIVQAHKADDALPKLVDQIGSSDIAGQTYHWHKDDIVQASITPQQGIARNATHWFTSSSSVIKKYDLTGTEVASNSSPFAGLSGAPDHIGDGYVDGSYYYLPVCDYDSATETATDVQIARYNISDLSLDGYWDVSGNGFYGAGLSLSIDGTEIVGTNYDTTTGSNTLYRFNKSTGAYIGTHTLADTIKGIQGISTDGTDYYISSHDTTAGRNIIYRIDSSFNTLNKITPVTVSNTTTYEGEGVECYDGKLYFHTINAAIRELTPLTLYIDNGLGSPQQFMTTPADTGTILMRVTPRTFYNYNSIIDNTVTANDWEAWVYATGQLSWRVDATFKCDYTLPSADQEYIVAFTWAKSGSNVTIKLGVDGTYRSTQTGVWQTAPSALWLAGKNASNNQGNNIYRDIFVFDKVLSDAELSDTYTNFDNLYATPSESVNALKLPKQYHPDFSRPGVKPSGPVEIDWSNPLARGLSGFFDARLGYLDLVKNTVYNDSDANFKANKAVYSSASTTDKLNVISDDYIDNSNDYTVSFTFLVDNSTSDHGLLSISTTGSPTSWKTLIWCDTSGSSLSLGFGVNNAGTDIDYVGSVPKQKINTVVIAKRSTTAIAAINGQVFSFATRDSGSFVGSSCYFFRRGSSTAEGLVGSVYCASIYNRALSASEIAALSRDPYQILKPAQPMMLFTSAGGGGGTTYDVYASFAFTHGLSQSGSAQAQGGITLASAVSCDDSATGDYNAQATLSNALTVSNSGLSQAQATAALAASLGYSVDGIIAFFVDVSLATSHSGTFSGTATGQGAISLDASLDQTVSSIAQTIASVVFNSSHGLQNTTGQSIDGAISLGVSAGFQTLGAFTISGNITLNASLSAQLNASAQANANLNLGAQIGLSVLAQAAAQAGITLSQVVSVVHTGTSTVFGITTPDGRIYTVEIDTRTLTIEAEDRTYTVN